MKKFFRQLYRFLGIILLSLYILNFGFGVIEIIPDNIPIFGNLDEGTAGGLIVMLINGIKKDW